jgi:hypothetical protein
VVDGSISITSSNSSSKDGHAVLKHMRYVFLVIISSPTLTSGICLLDFFFVSFDEERNAEWMKTTTLEKKGHSTAYYY